MTQKIKKWEVKQRLAEIEKLLYWRGTVGRKDLVEKFGISLPQASADLKVLFESTVGAFKYKGSIKKFVPTEEFKPSYVDGTIEEFSKWTAEYDQPVVDVPLPYRKVDGETLKVLSQAIHQQQSVEIRYRSLNTPKGLFRRISPHTIVKSSSRHHVRAYCHLRGEFRDFVLGRIVDAGAVDEQGQGKSQDDNWNTVVVAKIGPHSGLSTEQKGIIETDFDMREGVADVKVRVALLFYFLDQFSLTKRSQREDGKAQQIILLNPEILSLEQ